MVEPAALLVPVESETLALVSCGSSEARVSKPFLSRVVRPADDARPGGDLSPMHGVQRRADAGRDGL
jgi:hypothetical protein